LKALGEGQEKLEAERFGGASGGQAEERGKILDVFYDLPLDSSISSWA
jgi:hypothetical protein